jgi:hypothetical protein
MCMCNENEISIPRNRTKFVWTLSVVKYSYRHGTARLQVADGGTASNMEGSSEYIE